MTIHTQAEEIKAQVEADVPGSRFDYEIGPGAYGEQIISITLHPPEGVGMRVMKELAGRNGMPGWKEYGTDEAGGTKFYNFFDSSSFWPKDAVEKYEQETGYPIGTLLVRKEGDLTQEQKDQFRTYLQANIFESRVSHSGTWGFIIVSNKTREDVQERVNAVCRQLNHNLRHWVLSAARGDGSYFSFDPPLVPKDPPVLPVPKFSSKESFVLALDQAVEEINATKELDVLIWTVDNGFSSIYVDAPQDPEGDEGEVDKAIIDAVDAIFEKYGVCTINSNQNDDGSDWWEPGTHGWTKGEPEEPGCRQIQEYIGGLWEGRLKEDEDEEE